MFPYLDLEQRDPVTGKTDGLLANLTADQQPKIFTRLIDRILGRRTRCGAHPTTIDGQDDARVPDNVRIYLFAGTQHVPGGFLASQGPGQQQANPSEYSWAQRALLLALDRWVRDGVTPPASRHPRLSDETLLPQQKLDFPALPGVRSPLTIPGPYRAERAGLPAQHPLPFLVPNVDRDGNEVAGIRLPDQAVPLATYTGWNFRSPAIGQPEQLQPLTGSYIPFAVTRVAREQVGDPRAITGGTLCGPGDLSRARQRSCAKLVARDICWRTMSRGGGAQRGVGCGDPGNMAGREIACSCASSRRSVTAYVSGLAVNLLWKTAECPCG